MCMVPGLLASGVIPGIDPFDRAGKKKRKHEREARSTQWDREDRLRAEDRDYETAQRSEDRDHDETLADKGFGRGRGSWRGQGNRNRRALSYGQGQSQSAYQRDRTA